MHSKYLNYDSCPMIDSSGRAFNGYDEIGCYIKSLHVETVVMDCYPVVDVKALVANFGSQFDHIYYSDSCAFSEEVLTKKMKKNLTEDRVFGMMTTDCLEDYFIPERILQMRRQIENSKGKTLLIGVGAMLVYRGDINIHCSVARWESQKRFRAGAPNWNCSLGDADSLTKFKRGYFVEWRLADKYKIKQHTNFDCFMDTNDLACPKLISRQDYELALQNAASRPFRVVPYCDPGVWGGQWMKEHFNLDKSAANYAWCFDCVPEENSVLYNFNGVKVEMPAIDIVLHCGSALLGKRVQARFGNEFPIRFDFLDTMEGGNLSVQVHPTTQYIQENFNMRYTQDESYYLMDCAEGASVYLGTCSGVEKNELTDALESAQITGEMDVEKYVNKFPAKPHDHFLIPAGTVHCSGANTVVLEISSTPYIFTFKLWDWGRLGLDGKPRPINISHGSNVIDTGRDTRWVKDNLINQLKTVTETDDYLEEQTGLHECEPIETRRHWFHGEVPHQGNGSVCVLNLVKGEEAEVVSPTGKFQPYTVHYAETFIVPACVGDFIIRPTEKSKGTQLATIKAYIRG